MVIAPSVVNLREANKAQILACFQFLKTECAEECVGAPPLKVAQLNELVRILTDAGRLLSDLREEDLWKSVYEIPKRVPHWFPSSIRRWLASWVGTKTPLCWAILIVLDDNHKAIGEGRIGQWTLLPDLKRYASQEQSSCPARLPSCSIDNELLFEDVDGGGGLNAQSTPAIGESRCSTLLALEDFEEGFGAAAASCRSGSEHSSIRFQIERDYDFGVKLQSQDDDVVRGTGDVFQCLHCGQPNMISDGNTFCVWCFKSIKTPATSSLYPPVPKPKAAVKAQPVYTEPFAPVPKRQSNVHTLSDYQNPAEVVDLDDNGNGTFVARAQRFTLPVPARGRTDIVYEIVDDDEREEEFHSVGSGGVNASQAQAGAGVCLDDEGDGEGGKDPNSPGKRWRKDRAKAKESIPRLNLAAVNAKAAAGGGGGGDGGDDSDGSASSSSSGSTRNETEGGNTEQNISETG